MTQTSRSYQQMNPSLMALFLTTLPSSEREMDFTGMEPTDRAPDGFWVVEPLQ